MSVRKESVVKDSSYASRVASMSSAADPSSTQLVDDSNQVRSVFYKYVIFPFCPLPSPCTGPLLEGGGSLLIYMF